MHGTTQRQLEDTGGLWHYIVTYGPHRAGVLKPVGVLLVNCCKTDIKHIDSFGCSASLKTAKT